MAKKKKKAAAPEIRTLALMEPGVADAAYAAVAAEHVWTMDELLAEQYPQGAPARVPGGMAIALQRELRRRNRLAEKGY